MADSSRDMGWSSLILFFVLTFAITWTVAFAMILFREEVEAVAGPISGYNPVFILAVWGPAIAAFILITLRYGLKGLGAYLRRLTLWRMHWGWWAFLILSVPAATYFGAALNGELSKPFPFSPWHDVIPILFLTMIIGPEEEFGWRGFALPLLQRKMVPFWAAIILGGIWGVWHFPALIMSGTPQEGYSIAQFILAGVVLSLIMTAMFNVSRGSILIPALYHFSGNNPALPEGRPWGTIVLLVFAIVIVWITRNRMFSRDGGETELLLTQEQARQDRARSDLAQT